MRRMRLTFKEEEMKDKINLGWLNVMLIAIYYDALVSANQQPSHTVDNNREVHGCIFILFATFSLLLSVWNSI